MRVLHPLVLSLVVYTVVWAEGVDLADKCRATLDWSADIRGLDWTCDREGVWSLRSFTYELGDKLMIRFGPSTVVFGRRYIRDTKTEIVPKRASSALIAVPAGGWFTSADRVV